VVYVPTWREREQEPVVQDIRSEVKKKQEKIWHGKIIGAYKHYIGNKDRGIQPVIVPEFDEWQLRNLYKKRGEIEKMPERYVEIRLAKNFNVVVTGSKEIFTDAEFRTESEICMNEAKHLVEMLPDEPYGDTQPKKTYSKETYTKSHQSAQGKPATTPNARITAADINTQFLKGAQIQHAVKLVNAGRISLEDINNLSSWDEQQALIYTAENKKILFAK
jgi:hypothetical protein